ncbi:MAG: alpha/beta hydrolase [Candidatus Omnitrophota bacterium]|nr:alpha/beta hydrolase [Candidatus Omnitrophota bacterium]MBU1928937.1 alpha/beta hydrolase [Candidatus Omnitrophota bacterium]MBU2035338.1 alpha/beta hydrolase [Candidatus Omnitrophota bacterium]MBU2222137.1 alpha/beta hydrolase [Candidatus Omnitrophota bacterium]
MTRTLYLILFGVVIITAYIKYIESRGIFYPEKRIESYPSAFNISFEDVYVKTEDRLKINGWFIPQSNAKYTLLFFHGNAGNIGHRLEKLLMLRNTGVNIFIIDYRGFGKSEGKVSEKGLYLDAKAAYNYLVDSRRILPEQIILYGESLGTAVVIDLAANAKVKAIIVEGAFSSGKDMASRIYPFLPGFIFSNSYDSLGKIKKMQVAKLFIHSRNDEIVPFALANKLYNASPEPKELVEINGGHNTAFLDSQEKYISSIGLFIERL